MSKENGMPLEKLFGSKTRTKLLGLFFSNPEKSYYVREITRVIEEQINSVRRELTNLESIDIIRSETYDNKVYYSANVKHPFSHALSELFTMKVDIKAGTVEKKSNGWDEYIRTVKSFLDVLIVTNRLPGQDGIDLLIVGNDKTKKLTHWAEVVEKKQGKPLNYVIMSRDDFSYRLSVKDRYIEDVLKMEITEKYDPDDILKEMQ